MSWVKFDDQFNTHPKVLEAGPLAITLHMRAIIWCGQYLTDGQIRGSALNSIVDWSHSVTDFKTAPDNQKLAAKLVEVGLWEETETGWVIHDYLEYQPSRKEKLKEKRDARDRQKRHRKRNRHADVTRDKTCPDPGPGPVNNIQPKVDQIWSHWLEKRPATRRKRLRKSDPEFRLIRRRLQEYAAEDLIAAIDGLFMDRWSNDNGKLDFSWAMRHDEKNDNIARFSELARNPQKRKSKPHNEPWGPDIGD